MIKEQIKQAKQFIEDADAILITAGAGMGVDSGLSDFRGNEGFWKAYPVIKDLGISFQKMANPQWFTVNPPLAWAFYGHRLNLYRDTVPHDGFKMLLDLLQEKNDDYFIYTSNVDGQFQKAGFSQDKILEVHGSIHHFQCREKCTRDIWDADSEPMEIDMEKFEALNIPLCKHCGDIARPNILMFGDWSWNGRRTTNQEYKYNKWLKSVKVNKKKLAIIEIGAGTAIPTIRQEGQYIPQTYKNAKLIRINPREYDIDAKIGYGIALGGLEGLQNILTCKGSIVGS
jgi:NAD-dependent SIR2 family protein deacetylase